MTTTNTEEITIPAELIRGAVTCMAKNDVRYYLCGIFISSEGYIAGTNGHILFKAKIENPPAKSVIIRLCDVLPKTCTSIVLVLTEDDYGVMKLHYKGGGGKTRKNYIAYEKVQGKYPEIDRVIPKGELRSLTNIGVNPNYIGLVSKIFGKSGFTKFSFYGESSAIRVDTKEAGFQDSFMLIMPARY